MKTFVRQYDELVVREAILREVLRGGQVYYLYNDVENIEKPATVLRNWYRKPVWQSATDRCVSASWNGS